MENEEDKYSFACSCSEESRKQIAEVRKWAEEYLHTTDPLELLDRILYKLDGDYSASVDYIAVDQWGAISTKTYKLEGVEPLNLWIQFDHFFDGMLYVLKSYHEKYGDVATGKESTFGFK